MLPRRAPWGIWAVQVSTLFFLITRRVPVKNRLDFGVAEKLEILWVYSTLVNFTDKYVSFDKLLNFVNLSLVDHIDAQNQSSLFLYFACNSCIQRFPG